MNDRTEHNLVKTRELMKHTDRIKSGCDGVFMMMFTLLQLNGPLSVCTRLITRRSSTCVCSKMRNFIGFQINDYNMGTIARYYTVLGDAEFSNATIRTLPCSRWFADKKETAFDWPHWSLLPSCSVFRPVQCPCISPFPKCHLTWKPVIFPRNRQNLSENESTRRRFPSSLSNTSAQHQQHVER